MYNGKNLEPDEMLSYVMPKIKSNKKGAKFYARDLLGGMTPEKIAQGRTLFSLVKNGEISSIKCISGKNETAVYEKISD